jgi:hypothetical protein
MGYHVYEHVKKKLLSELENLENLEEDSILPGPLFARKGEISLNSCKSMRKRNCTGSVGQVRNGYWKVITTLLIFIVWLMGGEEKNTMYSLKKDA